MGSNFEQVVGNPNSDSDRLLFLLYSCKIALQGNEWRNVHRCELGVFNAIIPERD